MSKSAAGGVDRARGSEHAVRSSRCDRAVSLKTWQTDQSSPPLSWREREEPAGSGRADLSCGPPQSKWAAALIGSRVEQRLTRAKNR